MYDLMTSILAVCPSDAIIRGFNHVKGTKAHNEWSENTHIFVLDQ